MPQRHPTAEELEGFIQGRSSSSHAARNMLVLRHLLAACPVCREELLSTGWTKARLERLVHLSGGSHRLEAELPPEGTSGYDYSQAFAQVEQAVEAFLSAAPPSPVPLAKLVEELDRAPRSRQLALLEEEERFSSPQLVQVLLERTYAARYHDPKIMLHWARLAQTVAARCAPETLGSAARLSDLRARSWGEYGNALRVAGRLHEAEEAMVTAQGYFETGTGDPALKALLREQIASLYTFRRCFDLAIAALTEAAEIYRQIGETHALARALVRKAIPLLYSGKTESAVDLLNHAIPLIDYEADPHLLLAACHNLVRCYIDLDQPERALSLYSEARGLYREFGEPLILLRAGWQEGQLLRDLGHLRTAETVLLTSQQGFLDRGLSYEAAVIALDLAALYVKMGSLEDLQQTVVAAVPIFRALGVDRETIASLLQLQQVAGKEQQAMELIRFLTARLEPLAQSDLPK